MGRDRTHADLIRKNSEKIGVTPALARKRREREKLEQSFLKFQFKIGRRGWTREELNVRS